MSHPAALSDEQLLRQCEVEFLRRSGPGGQHRNKVETGVRLKHCETGLRAEATERRSQAENRRVALKRLRLLLAVHLRATVEEVDEPSDLWQSRCRNRRISVSADHADFPALMAEALDVLALHGFEPRPAAHQLSITSSQLTGLLRKLPAALQSVNERREALGMRRLR